MIQINTSNISPGIPMKIFIPTKFHIKQYQILKIIPDSDEIVFLIQAILGVFQITCDE